MSFISEKQWKYLNFQDFRVRFFIEVWRTLLHTRTPNFYKSRLMSPFSCLKEVRDLISGQLRGELPRPFLGKACEEAKYVVCNDGHIKNINLMESILIGKYLDEFSENYSNLSEEQLNRTKKLIEIIVSYENFYLENVLWDLKKSVLEYQEDANVKPRRYLDLIFNLSGKAVTQLLESGFSATYLFNRADLFTRLNNYNGRTTSEQFDYFVSRLLRDNINYTVLQPYFIEGKFSLSSGEIGDIYVEPEEKALPYQVPWSRMDSDSFHGYLYSNIEAKDYISAAWKMQRKVEKVKDLFVFEYKKDLINKNQKTVVYSHINGATHTHDVKIDLLERLLIRRPDLYPIDMVHLINVLLTEEGTVLEETKENLERSLKYYRLGLVETTFESKFLSLWISLESIFEGGENNVIENILGFVPVWYAYDSLPKRLIYLAKLVEFYQVSIPDDIYRRTGFENYPEEIYEKLELYYEIVSREGNTKSLYDSIDGMEFLRYMLMRIHEEFKNKKALRERISKTKKDVEIQISRIYSLRNFIVHKGHHQGVDPRLYSHLCDYSGAVLSEFVHTLATHPNLKTIGDVTYGYQLALEKKEEVFKKSNMDFYEAIFLTPLV